MTNAISSENTIGLKKTSKDSYNVIPCKFEFEGFSVTIGEGIKRAFPTIDLVYKRPFYEYIERFFVLEMQNIFQMPNDPTGNLIRAINQHCTRGYCIANMANGLKDMSLHDSMEKDIQLRATFKFFEPFLNRIGLNGTYNLSKLTLLNLISAIHSITLLFIDNLLKTTGSKIEIARELYLQELTYMEKEQLGIEAQENGYLLINKQFLHLLCLAVLGLAIYSYY